MQNSSQQNLKYKHKKTLMLPPSIGDWTLYRPQVAEIKKSYTTIKASQRLSEKEMDLYMQEQIDSIGRYLDRIKEYFEIRPVIHSVFLQQLAYSDLMKEMEMPVVQFRADSPDFSPAYVCIDTKMSNALINRATGADKLTETSKGFTEIEESILGSCVAKVFSGIFNSSQIKYINFPNFCFERTFDDQNAFALVSFKLGIDRNTKGTLYIIVPIKQAKDTVLRIKEEAGLRPLSLSSFPEGAADNVFVEATVDIGTASISANDLYGIDNGDVILTSSQLSSLLPIRLENYLQLTGQPGIKNGKLCVRISKNGISKVEKVREDVLEPISDTETPETDIIEDTTPEESFDSIDSPVMMDDDATGLTETENTGSDEIEGQTSFEGGI